MSVVETSGTLVTAIGEAKGAEAVAARAAVTAAGIEGAAVLFEVSDRKARPATVVATGPAKQLEAAMSEFGDEATVRVRGRICFVSIPDAEEAAGLLEELTEHLPAGVPWVVCAPSARYRQILETIPV